MGTRGKRRINVEQSESAHNNAPIVLLRSASDLRSLGSHNNCYDGLALNVEKLVKFIPDIKLEYADMDSTLSGSLSKEGAIWVIRVNNGHSKTRQRFSIAHELGHFVYHKDDENEFVDTTFFRGMTSDNLEYTANKFASELLMPEDQVRQLIDKDNIRSVAELAEKFGVSSAAMLYRVKELNYKTKE